MNMQELNLKNILITFAIALVVTREYGLLGVFDKIREILGRLAGEPDISEFSNDYEKYYQIHQEWTINKNHTIIGSLHEIFSCPICFGFYIVTFLTYFDSGFDIKKILVNYGAYLFLFRISEKNS